MSTNLSQRYGYLGAFEVGKMIGQGQSSVVHKAVCKEDGKVVALKQIKVYEIVDEKIRRACLKEIELLGQLNHVNVIQCYASFIQNKHLYIVLELASAGDLSGILKYFKTHRQLIPERRIWKCFAEIMRGLDHMHSKRVMHRDIKPANIFVTAGDTLKLGDLGFGRFFSQKTAAANTHVGTPYYMSPERMQQIYYNFKSDVWSVGCILYEFAALQSPFYAEKDNWFALIKKIENCEYPPVPADIYSQQLRNLVSRCICADPSQRPDVCEVLDIAEQMNSHFNNLRGECRVKDGGQK